MLKDDFGTIQSGQQTFLYTLKNKNGMKVKVTDYGATVVEILVPDQQGKTKDVVLGYDSVSGYENGDCFFGAVVGRNANRIGGAQVKINDIVYPLVANDNGNNLHSGPDTTNKRLWTVEDAEEQQIIFSLESPDKDQGYPGNVTMYVTYMLTDDNSLYIHYEATPDQDTILNLTNHSYFNLNGHNSGDICGHKVYINAKEMTVNNEQNIPTGQIVPVEGTPFDFTTMKPIGTDISNDINDENHVAIYDHNWVFEDFGKLQSVAKCVGNQSGITMEVLTDLPGMQMYTGNFQDKITGKAGSVYSKRCSVCFETQFFPDALNHRNFPTTICKAGEKYQTTTVYRFGL